MVSADVVWVVVPALIVKVRADDVPPPLPPVKTVTLAVPAVAMSVAVIVAFNWVALTYVVVRLDPFHCTTEPVEKFDPVTVRAPPAPPAVVLVGDSELMAGTLVVVFCAQAASGATSSANMQRTLSFVLNIAPPLQTRSC
jgi:hypothetical protein